VLDQGLSAVSNLLLSIVIARALDAGGYGSFAVAFLVFGVLVALTRADGKSPSPPKSHRSSGACSAPPWERRP
jgi:hypothetical protein